MSLIRTLLRQVAATIRAWLYPNLPVATLAINVRREVTMALEFFVDITKTGNESADIAYAVIIVDTTLAELQRTVTLQVAADATQAGPFYASDNTEARARFKYVDDAGNESAEALLVATITDTIAPSEPGPLAIRVTNEVPDADVPPVA